MTEFDPPYPAIHEMGFPRVERLRHGILLGCITNSFWLIANDPVSEQFWDNGTYVDDEMQGERWAVAFSDAGTVAVFYSTESIRNPFPEGSPPYNQSLYFKGMPHHLASVKKRALSWMLTLEWELGGPNAVVTSAMWADGDCFTAVESWTQVFNHSGRACANQLLPPEIALQEWWDGMELPGDGIKAAQSLYERRITSAEPMIPIEAWEWETYLEAAGSCIDSKKVATTRELLGSIGISMDTLRS